MSLLVADTRRAVLQLNASIVAACVGRGHGAVAVSPFPFCVCSDGVPQMSSMVRMQFASQNN